MSPSREPEALLALSGLKPFNTLVHADLVATINAWLGQWSIVLASYVVANITALALVALAWRGAGLGFADGFPRLCMGMVAGYVLLLPVHEYVHALAYRLLGARDVPVRYQWRELTAFCAADRFVVSGDELAFVSLAPFALLSALLLVALTFVPAPFALYVAGALLLHTGACSGDFAMVNLIWCARPARLLTYDDLAAGETYFFRADRT